MSYFFFLSSPSAKPSADLSKFMNGVFSALSKSATLIISLYGVKANFLSILSLSDEKINKISSFFRFPPSMKSFSAVSFVFERNAVEILAASISFFINVLSSPPHFFKSLAYKALAKIVDTAAPVALPLSKSSSASLTAVLSSSGSFLSFFSIASATSFISP